MISSPDLNKLNADVKERGYIDREHLLRFLSLIPNNDGEAIVKEVKDWLTALHEDPTYETVNFPKGSADIAAILSDLDSYGRVQSETILKYKQDSNKVLPVT